MMNVPVGTGKNRRAHTYIPTCQDVRKTVIGTTDSMLNGVSFNNICLI